ncbi:g12390 [Coccomyxa viridis]|uniref:G12390 protein n=1 Tax=Coccomyxa viridis TaxID=1274662 RepID=A0ABP1GCV9_9CHLO
MEVERLHLIRNEYPWMWFGDRSILRWCKHLQPQLAPTLTTLILGNVHHLEITSTGGLLAALSGCSRLRHLVLCEWMGKHERLIWGTSHLSLERCEEDQRMVETLSEKLPSLAVLELQVDGYMSLQAAASGVMEVTPSQQTAGLPKPHKRDRLHFDQELIRGIFQSEAAGMQLLQIDCGFGPDQMDCMCLPPTLRYLSSPCSFGAINGAIEPGSSILEEAVLFLGIAESVRTRCLELSSFTWAILSEILLPSAQTLKAVMLLLASARGYISESSPAYEEHYYRVAKELSLPQLGFFGGPVELWLHICSENSEQHGLRLTRLKVLFLFYNEKFSEGMGVGRMNEMLQATAQLTALRSLRLTVPPQWNEQTEINGTAWAMILALPNLSSITFVVTVDEPATADRELVDFISSAAMMFDRDAGGCGLQRLGILVVGPGLGHEECPAPGPDLVLTCGVPLAFEQGAEGVCTAIGDLVGHGVLPALTEFAICPVRHWKGQLNGPGGFYSGPLQGPHQASQVKCRALSPDREELMAYETSMYCSDTDSSEERACITRMISHMHA